MLPDISAPGETARRAKHRAIPTRIGVKLRLQKYSTLPKFGIGVCIAHPGSTLRGDHVS
ncbi:hypothetical protein [Bradyrhizobium zhanjiangense]|uniref:hypothetical protein n=1 Tax=Bradyrhizobium zhanjiangense TaxID=1325107 RepID=UPI0013E8BA70|nr:hypothetical protein [Bradyrhizobium zhanjiangense]